MTDYLNSIEYNWFLWLNSHHTPFWDVVMYWISYKFTWIPFYIFLIGWLFRSFSWKMALSDVLYLIAIVGLADFVASGLMKPYFMRPRPCHDPVIGHLVHIVNGCGGQYGFVSSHASNSFGLAVGIILIFGWRQPLSKLMLVWAIIVSVSRIYLGVHYFTDIFFGGLVGAGSSFLLRPLQTKINNYLKIKL